MTKKIMGWQPLVFIFLVIWTVAWGLFICIVVFSFGKAEANARHGKKVVGELFGLGAEPTYEEIRRAVNAEFRIGSSKDEVFAKIAEIDPFFEMKDQYQDYTYCASKSCWDGVELFSGTLNMCFKFSYGVDSKGLLSVDFYEYCE